MTSIYMTDYGPVKVGPTEDSIFAKAKWARAMGATPTNWLLEKEQELKAHLESVAKRLYVDD